jgi:hypothetical protein
VGLYKDHFLKGTENRRNGKALAGAKSEGKGRKKTCRRKKKKQKHQNKTW